MKTKKLTSLAMAACVLLAFGSSSAFAGSIISPDGFIQITDGPSGTGTNILYNPGETGFQINASINQNPGYMGVFTSTQLITSSGGQASLEAVNGMLFNLCFSLTDNATFTTLVLNPNASAAGNITFQITYEMPAGVFSTASFTLNAQGQNFFTIDSLNGAVMTEVCWTSDVAISNANQYRIDGLAPGGQAVPEGGATLMLLGVTLGGLALARRVLPKRSSAA